MQRCRRHRDKRNRNRNRNANRPVTSEESVQDPEEKQDLPYRIAYSDVMGRYLVAANDIKAGDLLMSELPLVVGPSQGCKLLCIGCYVKLEGVGTPDYRCPQCGWPLCGSQCPGIGHVYGHSHVECRVLSRSCTAMATCARGPDLLSRYTALVPLRCLLLRDSHPAMWETLHTMESHDDIRRGIPEIWENNQRNVVERVRTLWGMREFTDDDIHTVCGILEVNAFEIGSHGVRAIYPTAFLMAHDCVPNTSHTDDSTYRLCVRASRDITAGDTISLSYAYTLQPTLQRREHLLRAKFFECRCLRCRDPTELGTYGGALRCPSCGHGRVLSSAPLDGGAPWRCDHCAAVLPAGHVRGLLLRISDEADAIDANDVAGLEAFLGRHSGVLHPRHVLLVAAKHSLCQLYGKARGYTIDQLSPDLLRRKRDVCQDVLEVCDVLEPGMSRIRGICLYELHATLLTLTARGLEGRTMDSKEAAVQLRRVAAALQEAAPILAMEPPSSPEGAMYQAALEGLAGMRNWDSVLERM